jgi:hypothetical protein
MKLKLKKEIQIKDIDHAIVIEIVQKDSTDKF